MVPPVVCRGLCAALFIRAIHTITIVAIRFTCKMTLKHAKSAQAAGVRSGARRHSFAPPPKPPCTSRNRGLDAQVQQLEGEVGLPLYEQMGRRVDITPAGREIVERARAPAQRACGVRGTAAAMKGVGAQRSRSGREHRQVPRAHAAGRVPPQASRGARAPFGESPAGGARDRTENSVPPTTHGHPRRAAWTTAVPFGAASDRRDPTAAPGHVLARGKRSLPLARLAGGESFSSRAWLGHAQRHGARFPRTALPPPRNY